MMLRPLDRTLSPAPAAADEPLGAFRAARADIAAVLADPELAKFEYDGYFGRAVVERRSTASSASTSSSTAGISPAPPDRRHRSRRARSND